VSSGIKRKGKAEEKRRSGGKKRETRGRALEGECLTSQNKPQIRRDAREDQLRELYLNISAIRKGGASEGFVEALVRRGKIK